MKTAPAEMAKRVFGRSSMIHECGSITTRRIKKDQVSWCIIQKTRQNSCCPEIHEIDGTSVSI